MNHIQLDPRSLILRRCSLALLKYLVTDFKMCEIFVQKTWPIFNCNPVKTYVKILLKPLFNLGQYLVGKQLNFGATELHRGRGNLGLPCMGAMSHVTPKRYRKDFMVRPRRRSVSPDLLTELSVFRDRFLPYSALFL